MPCMDNCFERVLTAKGVGAVDGRIEARALYVALEGDPLNPCVGGGSSPLLQSFRFLILKRRTFIDC